MQTSLEQQQLFWLALQYIPQLGPVTQRKLWQQHGSIERVWDQVDIPKVQKIQNLDLARHDLELLNKQDIQLLVLGDSSYPERLSTLPDITPVLYCKGRLTSADNAAVAIVGTRQPSLYGIDVTQQLAKQLVGHGHTIVSGMALGIDTISHQAALASKGRTIAVLGSSLDMMYPASNRHLAEQIMENGAIVTQFKLGTRAANFTFPARNRLIAGFSRGVVVTEARAGSGSLITAQAAKEYDRTVFAVPGSIFSLGSQGPHQLLREGACLAVDAAAIVNSIGAPSNYQEISQTSLVSTDSTAEADLLRLLQSGPQLVDQLIHDSQLSSSQALAALSILELKGLVKAVGRGEYRLS